MGFGNPKHLFRFLLAFWAAHAGGGAFFFSLFSFEKLCWLPQAKTANTYKNQVLVMKKQTIEVSIPKQLQLLCELLEVTPAHFIQGFINDLALEVHGSNGSDERSMAVEYFMRCGYGMHRYDYEQVQTMFDGLNWLRWQWPGNDPVKEQQYRKERLTFLKQWHKEWKAKVREQ
jgi:hypothetical protein